MDPRGFPTSLPEFQKVFPDDAACADYLEKLRWPKGFVCPDCGWTGEPYRFKARPGVLRCRQCKVNTSLTVGTTMNSTHTPLSIWFWGAYLVTTQTPGQSALQFQGQLGLSRYETAFMLLHKLRSGMVRPERDCIGASIRSKLTNAWLVAGLAEKELASITWRPSLGPSRFERGKMGKIAPPNTARIMTGPFPSRNWSMLGG
jgi:hypothetical protein